jgi:hypothetical protein
VPSTLSNLVKRCTARGRRRCRASTSLAGKIVRRTGCLQEKSEAASTNGLFVSRFASRLETSPTGRRFQARGRLGLGSALLFSDWPL